MSNILIVNGAKQFAHSSGELNDTLTELANAVLGELGHSVKISRADSDYEIQQEIQKYVWADIIIYQMPGWWMGAPWTVKKYMDEMDIYIHSESFGSGSGVIKNPAKLRDFLC